MLSAAYGFTLQSHFSLSFVKNKFSKRMQNIVLLFSTTLMSIFLIIFIYFSIELTFNATSRLGPGTQISYAIPYSSTIVGGVLMLYYLIKSFYLEYSTRN